MLKTSVKDQVLSILNAHRGTYYSGQSLAEEIGVSRTAVWKAIQSLKGEGISIQSSTNLGYSMAGDTDLLDAATVRRGLCPEAAAFYQVECQQSVTSTNDLLRLRGMEGEKEGLCLLAAEQTAGKGRRGRSFYSPETSGLYLSILLRPQMSFEDSVLITTAAAVAGAKACEQVLGRATSCLSEEKDAPSGKAENTEGFIDIKWVNDLYRKGRKFCGILTEGDLSMESGGLNFAVMGIGFNLTPPKGGFPEEIADKAGSLFEDTMPVGCRNELGSAFLNEFYRIYRELPQVTYLEEYRKRLLWKGEKIQILSGNKEAKEAVLLDVNDRCELIVQMEEEKQKAVLNSGEISILNADKQSPCR